LAGQGQPGSRFGQGHLVARAFAGGFERKHGFERGLGGHERTAHVGKQAGRQVHAVDQSDLGLVGQVVAWNFGQRAGGTHHFNEAERGVLLVQCFPAQPQLDQCRGAKGGQQHIGLRQQFMHGALARLGFEVQRFVRHAFVHQGVAIGRVVLHRVACWRVDFGAAGAHLSQAHQGGRAGQIQGQAEDAHTAQGFGGGHAGPYGIWAGWMKAVRG
jgi:hypothetical protein